MRSGKDKTILLYALIDKLKPISEDVSTFNKLARLFKEVPIRRRWDQGGSEENGSETWAGGNGDGGNFVELVQGILVYLEQPVNKCTLSALECVCQLAASQSGLFKYFERKSNDKGMTLESQLIERLLELRANENPSVKKRRKQNYMKEEIDLFMKKIDLHLCRRCFRSSLECIITTYSI